MARTYRIYSENFSSSVLVQADSDFAVRVYARARGHGSPHFVTDAPTDAPNIEALRVAERDEAATRWYWYMRKGS